MKNLIRNMITTAAVLVLPLMAIPASAAVSYWDTTNNYVVGFEFEGTTYSHDMTLNQTAAGDLTGNGGHPAGSPHSYIWVIDSGTVSGPNMSFSAHYTTPADAVTPLTTLNVSGTIAANGTMSGTWTDNYQGGERSGIWVTLSGEASVAEGLMAEDFGVVDYNTELGQLSGYTAGFGLTNSTFEDAQSVVMRLYSGEALLQTNTATVKVGEDITGNQISSPFDVSGTFDYETDGYWINVREAQYGQSVPATKVIATVTLASGQILVAENTNLVGDPTTIYSDVPDHNGPVNKGECKKRGWKTFEDPTFRNQGQCVKWAKRNN